MVTFFESDCYFVISINFTCLVELRIFYLYQSFQIFQAPPPAMRQGLLHLQGPYFFLLLFDRPLLVLVDNPVKKSHQPIQQSLPHLSNLQAEKVTFFCWRPIICFKNTHCLFTAKTWAKKNYCSVHRLKYFLARCPIIDFVNLKVSSPGTIARTTGMPI